MFTPKSKRFERIKIKEINKNIFSMRNFNNDLPSL